MDMVGAHLHAQRNFPFFAESKGAVSSQRLGQGKRSSSAQKAEGLAYGMRDRHPGMGLPGHRGQKLNAHDFVKNFRPCVNVFHQNSSRPEQYETRCAF
jgi:hypothetical protein